MKQLKTQWEFAMHLLDYSFYVYWRQFEMLPLGIGSKLGFHPSTKAVLLKLFWLLYLTNPTSPPKQPPVVPWHLKIVGICNALVGLCFLYVLETI
jgi:hypothetical protein